MQHTVSKHLLNSCSVLGSVLGAQNDHMTRTDKSSCLLEISILTEGQTDTCESVNVKCLTDDLCPGGEAGKGAANSWAGSGGCSSTGR